MKNFSATPKYSIINDHLSSSYVLHAHIYTLMQYNICHHENKMFKNFIFRAKKQKRIRI